MVWTTTLSWLGLLSWVVSAQGWTTTTTTPVVLSAMTPTTRRRLTTATRPTPRPGTPPTPPPTPLAAGSVTEDRGNDHPSRRSLLGWSIAAATLAATTTTTTDSTALADDTRVDHNNVVVDTKAFVDPQGLFVLTVPKRFFVLRRASKGDLPDEATGKGRRGASIFSAGDMAKAEVIAVERFPTRLLLEENGIAPTGSLATIRDLGDPAVVAHWMALRRDRDKPGGPTNTRLDRASVTVSDDGKELSFRLRTTIDVQKPDLLLEQSGVSELVRVTAAKVSLQSGDTNVLAVFASALEQDWKGPDGVALEQSVRSFRALEQPTAVP